MNKVIIGVVDRKNTIAGKGLDVKQKRNFKNATIIRLGKLITRDGIVAKAQIKLILEIKM